MVRTMSTITGTATATTRKPFARKSPSSTNSVESQTSAGTVTARLAATRAHAPAISTAQIVNGTSFHNVTVNAPTGGASGMSMATAVVATRGAPKRTSDLARYVSAPAMAVVCANVTAPRSPVPVKLSHTSPS